MKQSGCPNLAVCPNKPDFTLVRELTTPQTSRQIDKGSSNFAKYRAS